MILELPKPVSKGRLSLEELLVKRASHREFLSQQLTREQLSQLLWSAQGKVHTRRTAPSAGATYPLEILAVIGADSIKDITGGIYWYRYSNHTLKLHKEGDIRRELSSACLGQRFIAEAPLSIVIVSQYQRTTARYGKRGYRYVYMEVGHSGQNIYLEAEALGLGTVAIGAFDDQAVAGVLSLPKEFEPLYIMPVGYVR